MDPVDRLKELRQLGEHAVWSRALHSVERSVMDQVVWVPTTCQVIAAVYHPTVNQLRPIWNAAADQAKEDSDGSGETQ